jgi:hypothetical protein
MKASSWPGAQHQPTAKPISSPLLPFHPKVEFCRECARRPPTEGCPPTEGSNRCFQRQKNLTIRDVRSDLFQEYKRKGPAGMSNRSLQDQFPSPPFNHHRASDGVDDVDGNGGRNSTHDSRRGDSKLVDGSIDIRTRDYSSRGCNSRTRNTQVHYRK